MAEEDSASRSQWPSPDFVDLAAEWCANQSARLLGYAWQAYDVLSRNPPPSIDRKDLERSLSEHLERTIHRFAMTGDEPFDVQHEPKERETRKPTGQPPEYDIAFVLYSNPRIMWPLEAKVLKNDRRRDVKTYVADVKEQYLTCRYAPFSSEAAMLGYLLAGSAETVFGHIAAEVRCALESHECFRQRPHRVSRHIRKVPSGKQYPRNFTCHHLLLHFPALSAQPELSLS